MRRGREAGTSACLSCTFSSASAYHHQIIKPLSSHNWQLRCLREQPGPVLDPLQGAQRRPEAQHFPDSPKEPSFPSAVPGPDHAVNSTTVFAFSG